MHHLQCLIARTVTLVLVMLSLGCESQQPTPYKPTATVEDLMRSVIDPAADAIWDAVVTEATASGIIETRPESQDDWLNLRQHALTLAEATNLLVIQGRRIASPESRSELPGIDLHPDAIQTLVEENWNGWVRLASELHDTSLVVLNAVDAQSIDALLAAGTDLDLACENCHAQYWYPGHGDPRPDNSRE